MIKIREVTLYYFILALKISEKEFETDEMILHNFISICNRHFYNRHLNCKEQTLVLMQKHS